MLLFSQGPVDGMSALVQGMDWRRSVDNTLIEAMMTQCAEAYAPSGLNELRGQEIFQLKFKVLEHAART